MDDSLPPPPAAADFTWPRSVWAVAGSSSNSSSATTEPSPRFSYYESESSSSSVASSSPVCMTTLPAPLVLPAATLDDLGADDSSSQTASLAGSSTPPGSHQPAPLAPKDITVTLPDDLVEPENFAQVAPHLYRSSFPKPQHFAFLKTLGLKTVVSLVQDEYPSANNEFLEREGIKFYKFGIPGGKEPSGDIPVEKIVAALNVVFDVRNLPILVHCNKGKHRTGCLVGCLRRAQNWANEDILAEYQRYSFPKSRTVDQEFIESFSRLPEVWKACNHAHLPPWLSPNQPICDEPEQMDDDNTTTSA